MSMLQSALPSAPSLVIEGITWAQFERLAEDFDEICKLKLQYQDGIVEMMAPPSEEHETLKTTVGYLLEAYFRHHGLLFYGCGSPRLKKIGQVAVEPDESYCIGSYKPLPDLAIEVILSSGSLNKRELYQRLEIPEVWFWQAKQLQVFVLEQEEYQLRQRSRLLPDLDLSLLEKYLQYPDQYQAVQEFIAALRQAKKNKD